MMGDKDGCAAQYSHLFGKCLFLDLGSQTVVLVSKQINTVTPPTLAPLCLPFRLFDWMLCRVLFLFNPKTNHKKFPFFSVCNEMRSRLFPSITSSDEVVDGGGIYLVVYNLALSATKCRVAQVCQGPYCLHVPFI